MLRKWRRKVYPARLKQWGLCKKSRRDYIYVEIAKKYFAPFRRNGIVRAKDAVPTERGKILFDGPTEMQSLRDFLPPLCYYYATIHPDPQYKYPEPC